VQFAFAAEPADCWHSGLGMEIGPVERTLQQTEAFEPDFPGSEPVAVGRNWSSAEAVGLRGRDK
jgi:hypothetical protein